MNNLSISYLVKANVYVEMATAIEFLDWFNCKEFNYLKAHSITRMEDSFEIHIEAITEGEFEDCLSGLKKLNDFLTKQDMIYNFGYAGITTIPATYIQFLNCE